jgi:hypothetical protein
VEPNALDRNEPARGWIFALGFLCKVPVRNGHNRQRCYHPKGDGVSLHGFNGRAQLAI